MTAAGDAQIKCLGISRDPADSLQRSLRKASGAEGGDEIDKGCYVWQENNIDDWCVVFCVGVGGFVGGYWGVWELKMFVLVLVWGVVCVVVFVWYR